MARATILVVDDSPTDLLLVTSLLKNEGYHVITAKDGEQALAVAAAKHPDLVVLDIVLPKKDGFQVCRELKSSPDTADVKVVLLSSKNQASDRFWGKRQGADEYVTKPFADHELLAAVQRFL